MQFLSRPMPQPSLKIILPPFRGKYQSALIFCGSKKKMGLDGDSNLFAFSAAKLRGTICAEIRLDVSLYMCIKISSPFVKPGQPATDVIAHLSKVWHHGCMKVRTLSGDQRTIMALQDEIRRSEKGLYGHRLHAVLLVAQGMSCRDVGKMLGDSPRAVAYWASRFESQGLAGLVEGERSGRPSRLTDEQLAAIQAALQKDPAEFGLHGHWEGKTLSSFIRQQWGTALGVRQCQRLFRQLGFQQPTRRPKMMHPDLAE